MVHATEVDFCLEEPVVHLILYLQRCMNTQVNILLPDLQLLQHGILTSPPLTLKTALMIHPSQIRQPPAYHSVSAHHTASPPSPMKKSMDLHSIIQQHMMHLITLSRSQVNQPSLELTTVQLTIFVNY